MKITAKAITYFLVLLGLIASGYLLWRFMVLNGHVHSHAPDICKVLFGQGCDAAIDNRLTFQWGLPLPGWGMVHYVLLLSFLLLADFLGKRFRHEGYTMTFLISLIALVPTFILFVAYFRSEVPFCPLCTLVHITNLALVFATKALPGISLSSVIATVRSWWRYAIHGRSADPAGARVKLLALFTAGLIGVLMYQWVLIEVPVGRTGSHGASYEDPEHLVEQFLQQPVHDIPVSEQDAIIGDRDAPYQIVLFSDFQCPACQGYAQEVYNMEKEFSGRMSISFKHFPLGKQCNPVMDIEMHSRACDAAYAAQAAHRQGGFWEMHDVLFATDLNTMGDDFSTLAKEAGLDVEQFTGDFADPAVRSKVDKDIALAVKLGVDATPTFYLNGRHLRNPGAAVIRSILKELQERGPGK